MPKDDATETVNKTGRYLLFMDILGFRDLVARKGTEDLYRTVTDALDEFDHWEKLNQKFRTIYFSDTFIFYQEPKGYGNWAFLDVFAIASMLFSALLAKGIAVRGAISFGDFEVRYDNSKKRQVYFGSALIEAYLAEQQENWIGITISPSAWKPYEASTGRGIMTDTHEMPWLRKGDTLLLNPFIKLRGCYALDRSGQINVPYDEWEVPYFPNEIAAFKFIHDESKRFIDSYDFTGRVATKYHSTVAFFRSVLGDDKYDWACRISGVKKA